MRGSVGVGILFTTLVAAGPLQAQSDPDGAMAAEEISGSAVVGANQPSSLAEDGSSAAEKLRVHTAGWLVGGPGPGPDDARVSGDMSQVAPPPDASDEQFMVYMAGMALGLLLIVTRKPDRHPEPLSGGR